MAYKDFSIESAISPTVTRPSVKLQGVANAVRIMQNPSRATEDYIEGAITSIGAANRQILYVNSSLEALNDRLRIASKFAYAINTSKRRGAEGFNDVPMMNPWAFALEDGEQKNSGFFKRVWEAIKTACRRIIDAIAHLIKYIGNAIAGMDTKAQAKHYELWSRNKAKIKSTDEVNKKEFKSPNWKIDAKGFETLLKNFVGGYVSFVQGQTGSKDVNAFNYISSKTLTPEEIAKFKEKIKADSGSSDSIDVKKQVEKDLTAILKSSFGATEFKSAHDIVLKYCCTDNKNQNITCSKMKELSNDFACLKAETLAKQVKSSISAVHSHQSEFAKYTKLIDKVAAKMVKDDVKGKDNAKTEINKINNYLSQAANARVRCNSFVTSLMLETQMMVLRFNKSAHIALKHYLRAINAIGNEDKDSKKETKESYISTESLFSF